MKTSDIIKFRNLVMETLEEHPFFKNSFEITDSFSNWIDIRNKEYPPTFPSLFARVIFAHSGEVKINMWDKDTEIYSNRSTSVESYYDPSLIPTIISCIKSIIKIRKELSVDQ